VRHAVGVGAFRRACDDAPKLSTVNCQLSIINDQDVRYSPMGSAELLQAGNCTFVKSKKTGLLFSVVYGIMTKQTKYKEVFL
ncbi:MAG: hypothetical protein IKS21_07205, partial [Oscillospiraceae bacterium]|nr:hypothetical protein [Oscillospiraceae bacterium]